MTMMMKKTICCFQSMKSLDLDHILEIKYMLVTLENFAIIAKIQHDTLMYYYLHGSVNLEN
jgi:hypothetical protein